MHDRLTALVLIFLIFSAPASAQEFKQKLLDNLKIHSDDKLLEDCEFLQDLTEPNLSALKNSAIRLWANALLVDPEKSKHYKTAKAYHCEAQQTVQHLVMEEKAFQRTMDVYFNLGGALGVHGELDELDDRPSLGEIGVRDYFNSNHAIHYQFSGYSFDAIGSGPLKGTGIRGDDDLSIYNYTIGYSYKRKIFTNEYLLYDISAGVSALESGSSLESHALVIRHSGEIRHLIPNSRPYYSLRPSIFMSLRLSQSFYPNSIIEKQDSSGGMTSLLFGVGVSYWPRFSIPNTSHIERVEKEFSDALVSNKLEKEPKPQKPRKKPRWVASFRGGVVFEGGGDLQKNDFTTHDTMNSPVFLLGLNYYFPVRERKLDISLGIDVGYKRSVDTVNTSGSATEIISEGMDVRIHGDFEYLLPHGISLAIGLGVGQQYTRISSDLIDKSFDSESETLLAVGARYRIGKKTQLSLDFSGLNSEILGGVFYEF